MKSVKVDLYVSAPPEQINSQYVCVSHMKIRWGRHRQNTHLPNGSAGCIEIRPDLDCSPPRQPQLNEQARAARGAEWEGEREMQLAVVQSKQRERQRKKCGLCVK